MCCLGPQRCLHKEQQLCSAVAHEAFQHKCLQLASVLVWRAICTLKYRLPLATYIGVAWEGCCSMAVAHGVPAVLHDVTHVQAFSARVQMQIACLQEPQARSCTLLHTTGTTLPCCTCRCEHHMATCTAEREISCELMAPSMWHQVNTKQHTASSHNQQRAA